MAEHVFKNREEFISTITRRARAVLGFRGVKNAQRVRICINNVDRYWATRGEITEDDVAACAVACADDTLYYSIEYIEN